MVNFLHGSRWIFSGMTLSLVFVFKLISVFSNQNPKFCFMHVLTKDVLGL